MRSVLGDLVLLLVGDGDDVEALHRYQFFLNFVFAISQFIHHQKMKILVPTPHNTLVTMLGRDKYERYLPLKGPFSVA